MNKSINCYKCKNFLETNPLCQMNRKTPQKVCKWFIPGRGGSKPKKGIISREKPKKPVDIKVCRVCTFNQQGFCGKYNRWTNFARVECVK
jgi:hypothetical protein